MGKARNWLFGLVIGVACLVLGAIGGALTKNFGTSSYTLSYADFISVLLTAISLLITLLGIILAIVGLIGWNAISARVKERTEDFLDEGFKEGNELYVMLRTRATEIMYEGVNPIETNSYVPEEEEEEEQDEPT